ncbi:MAG: hypothetical protein IJ079_01985 [Lachnospiraceae bacterium]|nr:hypothetical protein [Lachnospiraceae bacterium]
MNNEILVLKMQSNNNVVRYMADEIAKGFVEVGYSVRFLDLASEDEVGNAWEVISQPYAFIFDFQGIMYESFYQGEMVMNLQPNIYVSWILDDVLYHINRVSNALNPNFHLFFADAMNCRMSKLMFPDIIEPEHMLIGGFLPEGEVRLEDKDIDILFPAGVDDPQTIAYQLEDMMPIEQWLIESTIQAWKQHPNMAVRPLFMKVWEQTGEPLTGELIKELSRSMRYVDSYIRMSARLDILDALIAGGHTVHMVGSIPENIKNRYKKGLVSYGPKDMLDVLQMMRYSKIIMNPLPPVVEEGIHDRIYTSMLHKGIVYTPWSSYQKEQLDDRVRYIDLRDLDQMNHHIQSTLEEYDSLYNRIEENYQFSLQNHTWQCRGRQLVKRVLRLP